MGRNGLLSQLTRCLRVQTHYIRTQVAYDAYVFALMILNALNRPRKQNSEIVVRLKRDGIMTFMVWSVFRVPVVILSIQSNHTAHRYLPVWLPGFKTKKNLYSLMIQLCSSQSLFRAYLPLYVCGIFNDWFWPPFASSRKRLLFWHQCKSVIEQVPTKRTLTISIE